MRMSIDSSISSEVLASYEKSNSPIRYLDEWDMSSRHIDTRQQAVEHRNYTMEIVISVFCVFGLIVVCCMLCACCRKNRNRGQVLAPPPAIDSSIPAPYPQQQYTIAAYPVTHTATALQTAAPYPAAPYPTNTGPYPMPTANTNVTGGAPYPTGGAPYRTGGAPYPTGGAPYPTGGAPYPTGGAPYPTGGAPYPTSGPTAPDVNALPPTYDQAMGGIEKQLPYNPNAPH
ncbi:hypothetical protein K1T71_012488 [Dendrolimus kikuchii]|uniref:Uncharacterized protein n=1 Tax=Dendrolimus kikuchii TaxID=765133 RepID=A0ACC1CJF1_9NEOP|nr:hypothetical protein K1T71_012488 [Dendrolimus kikuchii]